MKNLYTKYKEDSVTFDVVVDDSLQNLSEENTDLNDNFLLSLVNGFESGNWRIQEFEDFIWNNIKETALNKEERDSLIGEEQTIIRKCAESLRFDKSNKGGEIGEILLYGVMKKYYSALPVTPKIFYKQNKNDYAKGADSVHIILDKDNTFSLWLGEAKFYSSIDNGVFNKTVDSVYNMLYDDKLRKELNIVTGLKDLDLLIKDGKLVDKIKKKLSDGVSLDEIKKQLHVPILIIHECQITKKNEDEFDKYKKKIREQHILKATSYIKKQNARFKDFFNYKCIKFHLILFPVPSKSELVDSFLKKVKFERGEA